MENVIYKISNSINNKFYIGSALKFKNRYRQHKHHLLKNTHCNRKLQNFVNKYGFETLNFEIIEFNVLNIIEREQYYIDTLNPFFNICKIAYSCIGTKRTIEQKMYMVKQRNKISPYQKGWKHNEISLIKISNSRKGFLHTDLAKKKISIAGKGRIVSNQTRIKISKSSKGKIVSEETKQILSIQKKGLNNPMFGKEKELHHNFGKKWICKKREITKKVIDTNTCIIYDSVSDACEKLNIPKGTFSKYILGYTKKVNNFKYYEDRD